MEPATSADNIERNPYLRGCWAAYRINEYLGMKSCPPNPYTEGTEAHQKWNDGFGDATDNLYILKDI